MAKTIDIISLGCSKNLVDSEALMGLMEANGYRCTHDSDDPQGDIVVVNTCGFINDAKEESINTILEFAQAKTEGRIERLYVMGCLSERYLADLEKEIPEVDGWYGKFNYRQLLKDLNGADFVACEGKRHITTPRHYAYLKISEGCDRHCAYCAIPLITGRHQSRPMEDILDEVRQLVSDGTKEFNVIAQELTYYGVDIDGKHSFTLSANHKKYNRILLKNFQLKPNKEFQQNPIKSSFFLFFTRFFSLLHFLEVLKGPYS